MKEGFSPLDEQLYLGEHGWSPETVKQMARQGTEIASHRRAATRRSILLSEQWDEVWASLRPSSKLA